MMPYYRYLDRACVMVNTLRSLCKMSFPCITTSCTDNLTELLYNIKNGKNGKLPYLYSLCTLLMLIATIPYVRGLMYTKALYVLLAEVSKQFLVAVTEANYSYQRDSMYV